MLPESNDRDRILVRYQNWSGCLVQGSGLDAFPLLAFDPAPGHSLPGQAKIILISHGHPEHVAGAAEHLSLDRRDQVTVIASPSVCFYLKKRSQNPGDLFHPVGAGDGFDVPGLRIEVFAWSHMSLLPESWREKARYLFKLAGRPIRLASIALRAVGGPEHGPMLGFRVITSRGCLLVYFGEGLHRRTSQACLQKGLAGAGVHVLLSAVEPEDCHFLSSVFSAFPIRNILAFEAHRIWRDQFGLPQADLQALAETVRSKDGGRLSAIRPGDAVEIKLDGHAHARI